MKKLLFIISIIAVMMLMCVMVGAKDYAPTNGAELNEAINEANTLNEDSTFTLNGDYSDYKADAGYQITSQNKLTFNLEGDIITHCRFYIIGKLVVNLNGHSITNKSGRGGANGSMFCLDKTSDNAQKGSLEVYNGNLTISDVCIVFQYGSLKLHDVIINANEEAIWGQAGSCEGGGRRYMIENCTFSGKDGTNFYCIDHESYVRNLTLLVGEAKFDSWHNHGNVESSAVFENLDFSNVKSSFITGANHYTFTDCKFSSISIQGDRNGPGVHYFYDCEYTSITPTGDKGAQIYVYESADCENAATLKLYTADDKTGSYDEAYSLEHPKLGHGFDASKITGVSYESYLEKGTYTSHCVRCESGIASESIPSAQELFVFLGYSTPEDGSYGIVASFTVNQKAVSEYEALSGKALSYGIVAGAKSKLGDNNPLDASGNTVSLENGSVVKASIDKSYVAYDFVLTGMNENQLQVELVIATYVVVTEGENVSVAYLQETQKTENLSIISYNAIPKEEI